MFDLRYYNELKTMLKIFYGIFEYKQKIIEGLCIGSSGTSGMQATSDLQTKYLAFSDQYLRLVKVHNEYLDWYKA